MKPPETSQPGIKHGFDNVGNGSSGADLPHEGEIEATEILKAGVGSLVTIQLLDTGKTSQFLITQDEREPEDLPAGARKKLPEGANLARTTSPLARAVMGKTTEDEDLKLLVAKSRPLKILEVKEL